MIAAGGVGPGADVATAGGVVLGPSGAGAIGKVLVTAAGLVSVLTSVLFFGVLAS